MGTPLALNCWVLGEDSTRIFPVLIDGDKNVCDLKKPAFDHIDADSLDVWNVSIPINEEADAKLEAQVKDLRLHWEEIAMAIERTA